jgi:hypothetical protein
VIGLVAFGISVASVTGTQTPVFVSTAQTVDVTVIRLCCSGGQFGTGARQMVITWVTTSEAAAAVRFATGACVVAVVALHGRLVVVGNVAKVDLIDGCDLVATRDCDGGAAQLENLPVGRGFTRVGKATSPVGTIHCVRAGPWKRVVDAVGATSKFFGPKSTLALKNAPALTLKVSTVSRVQFSLVRSLPISSMTLM